MQRLFYGGTNMYLGVDLGSTNIKAAIYDGSMQLVGQQSRPVEYLRENGFVEFDAERYYNELAALIAQLTRDCGVSKIRQIAFTGQAESLVCVDAEGRACMHAISWMDERSTEECKLLAVQFDAALCERVTGQQALLPTWPATKILWLKKNRPDVFAAAETFMLLKDYIVFRLTGRKLADMSIATFTFYFDIYEKHYWTQMLDAIGIDETRLPPLVEPCSVAGPLTADAAQALGLTQDTLVNVSWGVKKLNSVMMGERGDPERFVEHLTDLLGFQVFPVDELRAAGLGFAAQACDGDCGIGLPDEAEHAVDRIAPGRDAADKALEEDHLDIEGDFGQFDEKPCDGGQLVCRVALRPDHAAAAFDLGDLPDLSGGLLRAGPLFDSQFPGCAQCQRKSHKARR